jgi:integrase
VDDSSKYLTAAQIQALTEAAPWPFNVYVHVAGWSGLRAGELAGLQVQDVELPPASINPNAPIRPGALRIERTAGRVGKKIEYLAPKTKGSRRTVPLTPQTTAMLADYLAKHPRRREPTAPLFPAVCLTAPQPSTATAPAAPARERADRQADALAALSVEDAEKRLELDWAKPMRHAGFVKAVFRPAALRANRMHPTAALPPSTHPHQLRHAYASLCIAAGIPVFEVSRFMGHAKPSTTETVYAHLLRDDHSGAMAALGGLAVPASAASNVLPLTSHRVGVCGLAADRKRGHV